jgi:hypothetical protein
VLKLAFKTVESLKILQTYIGKTSAEVNISKINIIRESLCGVAAG